MSPTTPKPLSTDLSAACAARVDRLRRALEACDADSLLIGHHTDIRYLTGFVGHDSLLVVTAANGPPVIITDTRHEELLAPWRRSGAAQVVMGIRHALEQTARQVCTDLGVRRLGLQAEYLTIAARRVIATAMDGTGLIETDGLVGRLRMCKDTLEVAAIERAIAIHQEAMVATLSRLSPGMSELDFAAALEYEMKVRGASGPSFETCVSAGTHSAVIHYMTGGALIEEETLLVDWGAISDGYCSDMTRTYGVGGFPKKIGELYDIVLDAQRAAIDACAPGRPCAEIDGVARRIITDAGYGEQFGQGLGHGLGLDVHEPPFFNQQATGVVLEPGMVMTVEPGIYLPGVGGVRIEDDVLITDNGHRVLTDFPKDPSEVLLEPMAVGHA